MNKSLHNIGRYWFVILIGICVIASFINNTPSKPLPPPATSSQATDTTMSQPTYTMPAVSLPTGSVIKLRSAYKQGDGTLEINNGTDSDAEAKLITAGTSVFSVYIKAHTNYTIQNITDGTYWLAFALGTDWDNQTLKFNRPAGYSSFADTFDFTTTDTQYTTYSVTLNPVAGGTAQTNNVNSSQFDAY